jgi:hypothetical protein
MSSGQGRSPCNTGPPELRVDVIRPGTLAAPSPPNDGLWVALPRAGRALDIHRTATEALALSATTSLTAALQQRGRALIY